jgi:hypothetical protein
VKLEWINSELTPYLVRIEHEGRLVGYRTADLDGLADLFSDQAYAIHAGEPVDTYTVSRLTDDGIVPVAVKVTERGSSKYAELSLSWREPLERRKVTRDGTMFRAEWS